ncbi:MAG: fatty acid desaturase [Planctomycetes bacterium]|nr:fatty acid desaturase [Planctomycetota bacterium]
MSTSPQTIDPTVDPRLRRLDWPVIIAFTIIHLLALAAPFTFTWSGLALALFFMWFTACLGITLCYHRLLTHRSFTVPKWLEYTLTIIGTLNWQGGPIHWVGTHRLHHAESDQPADPHSPRHGTLWAHIKWTCFKDGKDFKPYDAAKDLTRDPVLAAIDRWFFIPQFALAIILYAIAWSIGGHALAISWFIWVSCLRTVVVWHGTWAVNSASHLWGYRNFKTTDDSRNNWWVAMLSFGEGWHNNHHAYQRSAAHGLRWWEFDMTWLTIRFLALIGLAKNVVVPESEIPAAAARSWSNTTAHRGRAEVFETRTGFWVRLFQLLAMRS